MTSQETAKKIRQKAYQIGFDLCGFTSDFEPTHKDYFLNWLEQKKFAQMNWLEQNTDKRLAPNQILPQSTAVIMLGVSYHHTSQNKSDEFVIAQYAFGKDYHIWMKEKLEELAIFIQKEIQSDFIWRSFVDTGPVLERDLADKAGLGWIGKNTCLINKKLGSYVFLSEIFCNLNLPADIPPTDLCGKCTLCLDACPTQALVPYQLEPQKCLAYQNIEKRGERDSEYWPSFNNHLVGCDICQDVCPWNHSIDETRQKDWMSEFTKHGFSSLKEIFSLTEIAYKQKVKGSAISRIKYPDFMRNVFLVIANTQKTELIDEVLIWETQHKEFDLPELKYCLKELERTKTL